MRPDARPPRPAGDGEMAGLVRSHDWGATPLGPIATWPTSLRVAARLTLTTRHPVFIWWGPELIQLYNDAYRATMGPEKHPAALGGRGRDTWAEIWGAIGPQIAQVMRGGPATWHEDQLVPVTRRGSRGDVWWTYSFSPIDREGAPNGVGGAMVICRDVTQEHLAKRTAQESEARYRELFEAMEEGYLVADVIFDGEDWAVDIEHREADPAAKRMVGTDLTGRLLREVDPRYEEHWYETFGRVARTGVGETGVLCAEPGDVWYEFRVSKLKAADPTSSRITVCFLDVSARVRTELALRQSEERQAHLLQLSDALRPLTSLIDIQHVAMQVLGRRLGVSRAQYYVADETGDYLTSSGGYTDGVPAAVGRSG